MELRCTAERETHLLSILRRELQLSSTLVRRLKSCGAYTVNGEPAHTDRPVRPGDVAKALDVDSKEVSKAIDELKKSGKIMSPKRCYYAPAE